MSLTEHLADGLRPAVDTITNVDIVMTDAMWQALRSHLLRPSTKSQCSSPDEQLAFLLASSNRGMQR